MLKPTISHSLTWCVHCSNTQLFRVDRPLFTIPLSPLLQLEACGCRIVSDDTNTNTTQYFVEDPRKLRRLLEQRLTLNHTLCRSFLDQTREHLDPPAVLHAALKPMEVTGTVRFFLLFVLR